MRFSRNTRPSLVRTITVRLVLAALVAIVLQITIVVARAYLDENDLNRSYVTREAYRLSRILRANVPNPRLKASVIPAHYTGANTAFYAFRVLREDGSEIAERNSAILAEISPWKPRPSRTQDLWLLDLDTQKKLYVAGGLRQKIDGHDVWIEIATLGDPDRVYLGIVAAEVLDDVWIPMMPLVVLLLGVAILSIRHSLRGLERAAAEADLISPLDTTRRFDVSDMPKEAASLAIAINGLLDRVGTLVKAQRLFIARAAHELRTPLAVIMLELGRIPDARVRRLEDDVRGMGETVDRLLTLARLESIEGPETAEIDVGHLAEEIVARLRSWAESHGHAVRLHVQPPARVLGDVIAIREAIRNLIDNAVKHTPAGASIDVTVGPGGRIMVEDSGPGLPSEQVSDLMQPFKKGNDATEGAGLGLAIVRQAVDLHQGRLTIESSACGGARFILQFPDQLPLPEDERKASKTPEAQEV